MSIFCYSVLSVENQYEVYEKQTVLSDTTTKTLRSSQNSRDQTIFLQVNSVRLCPAEKAQTDLSFVPLVFLLGPHPLCASRSALRRLDDKTLMVFFSCPPFSITFLRINKSKIQSICSHVLC